jgi:hypothetical protein
MKVTNDYLVSMLQKGTMQMDRSYGNYPNVGAAVVAAAK